MGGKVIRGVLRRANERFSPHKAACAPNVAQSDNNSPGKRLLSQRETAMAQLAAKRGPRLEGKVAIVTGAGSGIGQAIAILFAREGAKVIVADLNPTVVKRLCAASQRRKERLPFQTNVTADESIQLMVARTKELYEPVDILVNNAGGNVIGSVLALLPEQWQQGLELNLTAAYRCCRFVLPEISKSGGGAVIMMASVQGVAGFLESGAYAAAKGGIISLTRQLARDLASKRVRVNSISPGVIRTPIFDSIPDREAMFEIVSQHTPLGHLGVPEDVAFASLFLASDESFYVTGTNLVIDGGMTMRGV